jgi:hypothetical protein
MTQIVTPAEVERQLYALSKETDTTTTELIESENIYSTTKAQYEVAMARTRMEYSMKSSPTGKNYTVSEREDMALLTNEGLHLQMAIAEARVKAARANASRIKTKVDIARSIGTSVRSAVDIS